MELEGVRGVVRVERREETEIEAGEQSEFFFAGGAVGYGGVDDDIFFALVVGDGVNGFDAAVVTENGFDGVALLFLADEVELPDGSVFVHGGADAEFVMQDLNLDHVVGVGDEGVASDAAAACVADGVVEVAAMHGDFFFGSGGEQEHHHSFVFLEEDDGHVVQHEMAELIESERIFFQKHIQNLSCWLSEYYTTEKADCEEALLMNLLDF